MRRRVWIDHPRGGALPAGSVVTSTGIPLPSGIRYDPMGFAGLGQQAYGPMPWVSEEPSEEQVRAARRSETWGKTAAAIGLIGGILGIVLSLRALRARRGK